MSDFYYDPNKYSNFVASAEIQPQKCILADMSYKLAKSFIHFFYINYIFLDGFTKNKRLVLCTEKYLLYFKEVPKQWTS